jgi:hypothetical protein
MVKIVQLLCPKSHCLLAVAYEEGRSSFGESCDALKSMIGPKGQFNDHCGICGSRELRCEEGKTGYRSLQEAAPALGAMMHSMRQTRAALDKAGLTFDKARSN